MKEIQVKAPPGIDVGYEREWSASYKIIKGTDAVLLNIVARSSIDVVVARITGFSGYEEYYISGPNFDVAIPPISSLANTWWILERLIEAGMPSPDAVTVAQVLKDMGDFKDDQSDYEQAVEALEKMREEAHMRLQQAEAAEQRELEAQKRAELAEAELASLKARLRSEQKERP